MLIPSVAADAAAAAVAAAAETVCCDPGLVNGLQSGAQPIAVVTVHMGDEDAAQGGSEHARVCVCVCLCVCVCVCVCVYASAFNVPYLLFH
jgi:hypothetical protein